MVAQGIIVLGMKRLILLSVVLFTVVLLHAQDIIITMDAQKIEAKIYEVSKTEIRYKKKNNMDGPMFVLPTSDISSIIYANGEVTVYNKVEEAAKPETPVETSTASTTTATTPATTTSQEMVTAPQIIDEAVTIHLLTGVTMTGQLTSMNDNGVTFIQNGNSFSLPASQLASVNLSNGSVKVYHSTAAYTPSTPAPVRSVTYLSRSGNTYYYGGLSMDKEVYADFLQRNCYSAYSQFHSGKQIADAGWILLSAGLGFDLGSLIGQAIIGFNNPSTAMTSFSIIASCFEIACIPTLIVGYTKMHRSVDTFNSSCASKMTTKSYWSINASENGIGVAYNF